MGYLIYDNGASIGFVKDGKQVFIMKSAIARVSVVRGDIVRISTGNCLGSTSFSYQNVSSPVFLSAMELVNQISYWIFNIGLPPS